MRKSSNSATVIIIHSIARVVSPAGYIVESIYEKFVEKSVDECLSRCRDDLTALTRFVTWDLHERSAGALRRSLPDSSMVQIYSLAVSVVMMCFVSWQGERVEGIKGLVNLMVRIYLADVHVCEFGVIALRRGC